jgi:predicted small lipoprotein YifL
LVLQAVKRTATTPGLLGCLRVGLAAALLGLGALSLVGCGVRGSLEAPPQEKTETGAAVPGTPGQPVPHKPSILDPLIR